MKITAIKYFTPKIGLRCRFIVKVETDAGIYGLGEAGTAGRERALAGMIDHYREFLIGQDPRRIEDIAQVMYRLPLVKNSQAFTSSRPSLNAGLSITHEWMCATWANSWRRKRLPPWRKRTTST